MADVRALLDEFAAAFEEGGSPSPDPGEWLERVAGGERQELASLIDQYLMTAPRRAWDAEAFESSLAKVAVERVLESRDGLSGTWPELLPRLRNRARLKRGDLVRGLATALGVGAGAPQLERVGLYYHRMEHGSLRADGVSPAVLDALAGLVSTTGDVLRRAGAAASPPPPQIPGAGPAYARLASPAPAELHERVASEADLAGPAAGDEGQLARIDDLFTGA